MEIFEGFATQNIFSFFCHFLILIIIKGIVHPVWMCSPCMDVFVLPNTKEDILKKVCNRAVLGHH